MRNFLVGVVIIGVLAAGWWWYKLRVAHASFENYAAFRGCVQILNKQADFGTCKIQSGQTIKMVKFSNKWYLDGDLPWACLGAMCFGI